MVKSSSKSSFLAAKLATLDCFQLTELHNASQIVQNSGRAGSWEVNCHSSRSCMHRLQLHRPPNPGTPLHLSQANNHCDFWVHSCLQLIGSLLFNCLLRNNVFLRILSAFLRLSTQTDAMTKWLEPNFVINYCWVWDKISMLMVFWWMRLTCIWWSLGRLESTFTKFSAVVISLIVKYLV